MKKKIRNAVIAVLVVATGSLPALPAGAEILSLRCVMDGLPAGMFDALWIDLDQRQITFAIYNDSGLISGTMFTVSVKITPEAYDFDIPGGMGHATVDRMTGIENIGTPAGNQPWRCTKDSMPFPATKF